MKNIIRMINEKKINSLVNREKIWKRFLKEDLENGNETGIRVCKRELDRIENEIFVLRQKSGIIEIEEI